MGHGDFVHREDVRPEQPPPELELAGVSKSFLAGDDVEFVAIEDVNLSVERGSFVALVGPSGCGKSTLLNMTAGLYQPTAGEVRYRGNALTGINLQAGYMTQQDNLLPWRTTEANIRLPLEIAGIPRRKRSTRVQEVMEMVGLSNSATRYPSQLSGGMRKRASLARCLVYDPAILLMDEPFAALDAHLRLQMQIELLDIWERATKTVLFVTHDLDEAILLADIIVIFGTNPGRIVDVSEVPIRRPREVGSLRQSEVFASTWNRLWEIMRDVPP